MLDGDEGAVADPDAGVDGAEAALAQDAPDAVGALEGHGLLMLMLVLLVRNGGSEVVQLLEVLKLRQLLLLLMQMLLRLMNLLDESIDA